MCPRVGAHQREKTSKEVFFLGSPNGSSNFTGNETAANLNSANAKAVTIKAKWTASTIAVKVREDNGGDTYIKSRSAPNFQQNATTDEGMFSSTDYYGTTYYYRGAVPDNCLYFAGYYWKIVRVNGDSSTKLIYNGNSCTATGINATTKSASAFNSNGDNAYVGYMYGSANASSYTAAHANTNNSNAKTYLQNWYSSNISSTYRNYVNDTLFCGDRYVPPLNSTLSSLGYNQRGYGRPATNPTMYNTYYRHDRTKSFTFNGCSSRKDDRFTVSDTTNGNGKSSYPVGLLDADEAVAAGVAMSGINCRSNNSNTSYYLHIGVAYHLMTPGSAWTNGNNHVGNIEDNGDYCLSHAMGGYYYRPVINLKPSVKWTSGNGTSSSPYNVSL